MRDMQDESEQMTGYEIELMLQEAAWQDAQAEEAYNEHFATELHQQAVAADVPW